MTATEYVVLVDETDQETGTAEKLEAHQRGLLHRAFSVFIFRKNPTLELLLQQRALHKYHSAGLWTNTCCSHPRLGESILAAGERRLQEEIGLSTRLKDAGSFRYTAHFENGLSENEFDHVLTGFIKPDTAFTPNPEEVHAIRWVELPALHDELENHPELFTPWFERALRLAVS